MAERKHKVTTIFMEFKKIVNKVNDILSVRQKFLYGFF